MPNREIHTMNMDGLWDTLTTLQHLPFTTARGLEFHFHIQGREMFVSRKDKSITYASVELAFQRVKDLDGQVSGPKMLNVFGASYIYPIFLYLGIITSTSA